ncbi:MAG: DUF3500 domain-containing protein [Planctomycetota bacterium]
MRHRVLFVVACLFLTGAWVASKTLDVGALRPQETDPTLVGGKMVDAANAFIKSLDAGLKRKVQFSYEDEERFNWHFIPRGRLGVSLSELAPKHVAKLQALIQLALSEKGYEKVEQVRFLESVLQESEGKKRNFPRSTELYNISFYGKPSKKGAWTWRFEGHHLSLNFTVVDSVLQSNTPLFYGANPAEVLSGPKKGLRVLAPMEDLALEFVNSLDEEQAKVCRGKAKPEEVKSMTKARYTDALPKGVSVSALNDEQKGILVRLFAAYTSNLEADSRERLHGAVRDGGVDDVQVHWLGGTKRGEAHSYIIHGPAFVISFSNVQNGAKHIHASIRMRDGEFNLKKK